MIPSLNLSLNLFAGWLCFLLGAISGALIGLRFHREDWLGGYQSFRRRLLRLGQIAFFGLGLINILFVFSAGIAPSAHFNHAASLLLAGGAATMPLVCFLGAWKPAFRHVFLSRLVSQRAASARFCSTGCACDFPAQNIRTPIQTLFNPNQIHHENRTSCNQRRACGGRGTSQARR